MMAAAMERAPGTVGVGKSVRRDPLAAGAEAARESMAPLGAERPGLVLVFATAGYDQQLLLDAIRGVTGDAPLSGCSGEGVITQAGADEQSHAVTVMAIASRAIRARTALVTGVSKDAPGAAEQLARIIGAGPRPPRLVLLFADGVTFDCGAFLAELERRLPVPVPLVGGTAGTELGSFTSWTTWQYHDRLATSDAVAAVLLDGEVEIDVAVSHGCEPTGVEFTVTRSDGATVAELDGRPAFEVLREFLYGEPEDLSGNEDLHLVLGLPLAGDQREGYGEFLIRAPIRLDKESGAVFFTGGGLTEGRRVALVRRNLDRMREASDRVARQVLARHTGERPLLVLQFDCTGRGRVLCGDQTTAVTVDPLQEVIGKDVPWIGFHTFGEIAPLGPTTYYHACTVALCALYPSGPGAVG